MKHRKLLTAVLSVAMCLASMAGTMTAYADDLPFVDPFSPPAQEESEEDELKKLTEIFVNQLNDARVKNGLSEVYIAPELCQYSQKRSVELVQLMEHSRPDGRDCFSILDDNGMTYRHVAENISAGWPTVITAFTGFMNSPRHYPNMMMNPATHFGFGYTYDPTVPYSHFWQMFILEKYNDRGEPFIFEGQYIPIRDLGDVNGTKEVDAADATIVQEYSVAMATNTPYPVSCMFAGAADVNKDGQINAIDANIILSYAAQHGVDPDSRIEDFSW